MGEHGRFVLGQGDYRGPESESTRRQDLAVEAPLQPGNFSGSIDSRISRRIRRRLCSAFPFSREPKDAWKINFTLKEVNPRHFDIPGCTTEVHDECGEMPGPGHHHFLHVYCLECAPIHYVSSGG